MDKILSDTPCTVTLKQKCVTSSNNCRFQSEWNTLTLFQFDKESMFKDYEDNKRNKTNVGKKKKKQDREELPDRYITRAAPVMTESGKAFLLPYKCVARHT